MSIVSAKKIFIDPGLEITFLSESIISAKEDRIILIAPQDSLIFSTLIGLKTLLRVASKHGKSLIIVTEDEFGIKASQKLGFVTVARVSQVTEDLWDIAKAKQSRFKDKIVSEQFETEIEDDYLETDKKKDEEEKQSESEEELEGSLAEESEESEKVEETTDSLPEEEVAQEEEVKPRETLKVIDKGNIKLFVGSDVRKSKIAAGHDKINDLYKNRMNRPLAGGSYIGKDLTKELPKFKKSKLFKNPFKRSKVLSPDDKMIEASMSIKNPRKRLNKKKILKLLLLLIPVSIIAIYFLMISMVSASITVEFKKDTTQATNTVNADSDPNVLEINYDNLTIPAKYLEVKDQNISRTADANGTGETGVKAKGTVTIYNLTNQTVALPKGTVIKLPSSGREYVILKDLEIKAGSANSETGTLLNVADDVPVEAKGFGPEYNLTSSDTDNIFNVGSYTGTSEVYAKRFRSIEGGTKETFVSVSQDNYDKLKAILLPELQATATAKLKEQVPTGYRLIEESIKFEETKAEALPKVSEKASDKNTFTLSIQGNMTGIAIRNEDLNAIAKYILTKSGDIKEGEAIDNVANIVISSVTRADKKLTFSVSTKGNLVKILSEDDIFQAVKGKDLDQTIEYVKSLENVEKYFVEINPSYFPDSFLKVPNNKSKVKIVIK